MFVIDEERWLNYTRGRRFCRRSDHQAAENRSRCCRNRMSWHSLRLKTKVKISFWLRVYWGILRKLSEGGRVPRRKGKKQRTDLFRETWLRPFTELKVHLWVFFIIKERKMINYSDGHLRRGRKRSSSRSTFKGICLDNDRRMKKYILSKGWWFYRTPQQTNDKRRTRTELWRWRWLGNIVSSGEVQRHLLENLPWHCAFHSALISCRVSDWLPDWSSPPSSFS